MQNAHGWTRSAQIDSNVGTTERDQSQYIWTFARDLMKEMGNPTPGAPLTCISISTGFYWGLYNPVEYPRYFGASHFGGEEDDFDDQPPDDDHQDPRRNLRGVGYAGARQCGVGVALRLRGDGGASISTT
ncbi:MAG: hypothetical protein R3F11_04300 [Verrucomicrobiales bacterium]